MRGKVAKRLRKVAKLMAEVKYQTDADQITDPEFKEKAEKKAYKLLKKNYNK